jgi:hypothetical protein
MSAARCIACTAVSSADFQASKFQGSVSTSQSQGKASEMSSFRKASKKQSRLRMALDGPAGSGKTLTGLRFAFALGKKVAVINTESGAVEKYLGMNPDGVPFDFDICDLPDFSPTRYTQIIQEAGRNGYDVILIDSLSHAWAGSGGALELKDKKGGNSFTAWKDITPMHNQMIEAILRSPCHVIATMRSKMEYVLEEEVDSKTGAKKSVPRKVGMAPVQRQGMEYEFDIVADLDWTHTMNVTKSRCPAVDGLIVVKPGAEFISPVRQWLEDGGEIPAGYFATSPEQLASTAEVVGQQADEMSAAARREQLKAMAAATAPVPAQAPVEQAPFETTAPAAAAPAKATVEQLQELVALGAKIGRTPQQIVDECKSRIGCTPSELPHETAAKLVASFRAAAEAASKNQSAA